MTTSRRILAPCRRAGTSRLARRSSCGFTVLEVLVALLLLTVGALGVVASMAWEARLASEARQLERQALGVQSVVDSLRSVRCGSVTSGSATVLGGTVGWSVVPFAQGATITTTAPPIARRTHPLVTESAAPCE
jgi:prepilin-type N-terminal cleavage/methylation domain-containing protein